MLPGYWEPRVRGSVFFLKKDSTSVEVVSFFEKKTHLVVSFC